MRRGRIVPAEQLSQDSYSIRLVSRLTGIEPDTLRVWERRYGFPHPTRTTSGTRVYQRDDVRALQLIARAIHGGYRPSEVVGKSVSDLEELQDDMVSVSQAPARSKDATVSPESLVGLLLRDDAVSLRSAIHRAALLLGPRRFVSEFAHPASVLVGRAWAKGGLDVRHEHLFTMSLSRQLQVQLTAFEDRARGPRVLLATLPGEMHSLGLDMVALYLATWGFVPFTLGSNTPPHEIAEAARAFQVAIVGLSITEASEPNEVRKQVRSLLSELSGRETLWLGGAGAKKTAPAKLSERLRVVSDFAALDLACAGRAELRTGV